MAYNKIRVIHTRLDRSINYVLNPEKTVDRGTGRVLVGGVNCTVESAYRDMMNTKRRWDKTKGVLGYHVIHSFVPGEVTPEQAQVIGMEFAQRLIGDRFEAVVSTHTDHDHVHCHIVFNSVSFMDGKMYRDDFKAYFHDIRGISNDISRENNLSVIEPQGAGKHYAEWNAEQNGRPTIRGLVRQDIDAALAEAFTMQSFYAQLEKRGYTIKRGPNVKHTAIKPPGGERFIRLGSLGDGYTEAAIRERLGESRAGQAQAPQPEPVSQQPIFIPKGKRYYIRRGVYVPHSMSHGFRRMYLRYLYLLSPPRPYKRRPVPFPIRAEVRRLNQYKQQFTLLNKYHIDNESQLSMLADALQADIDSLVLSRRDLYRRKRQGEDVTGEISALNLALRPIRRELKCCQTIRDTIPQIQEHIQLDRQTEPEQGREKTKSKERRNELWK